MGGNLLQYMEDINVPNSFDTVTEAVSWLQNHGYTHDFNLDNDCITAPEGRRLRPDEFHIVKVFRFEGMTDPGDEDVVYAISSADSALKGILVAAYGTYADTLSKDMLEKLSAL